MTQSEIITHMKILQAIEAIVQESDGEVSYSSHLESYKELFSKAITKTTVIEIRIKRNV